MWLVCHRRAKRLPRGIDGLSQTCESVSMGCGWSIAEVARGNPCGVISLLRRRCRLQGMVSVSTREKENSWDMESFDQA